ncbi:MAG: SynChlorMet cassette radical SAM/SPASM protein ScmF [Armatimonadetes bacterium]|nr:SynChlorMet cassette radical SAM/SPASM protein ScmF [Armatimonadota bacterium]
MPPGAAHAQPQPEAGPRLAQFYFYLTEGCNCACRHCWLAPKFDPEATRYPTLPVAAFERVIAEALPLGLGRVKLTGGEPLMHPDIGDLLAVVRREDLALTVETNGLRLTEALADAIAGCRQPFVSVSLDGAEAGYHDKVRGVPGAFDLAVAGVRHLVEAGLKPQLILSVMRDNVGQVEPVVRLAEQLGAGSVKFNLIQPTERGVALHEQGDSLTVPELIDLGRWVEGDLAGSTELALHFDYPRAFRSLARLATRGGQGSCGILGILGVLASGQYALCGIGESVPELLFGQVGQVPLAEVWYQHPVLLALRDGLPGKLGGICAECLQKSDCLGSCIAQNYYRAKDLFAPYWFCEEADQLGLFPASRRVPVAAKG